MVPDRAALEALPRTELVDEAVRQGVRRPDVMTRVELVDEILRLSTPNPVQRKEVRGWLGVARDLLASVVDKGLHLPDAAAFIRGEVRYEPLRGPQPPVATVTLAEIYGAQGHFDRAVSTLDEVLSKEPDLDVARRLRDRFAGADVRRGRPSPAVPSEPPRPCAAVLARTDATSCTLHFDVTSAGEARGPKAERVIRVVEMRPRPNGAERVDQEIEGVLVRGKTVISGLEPGSVVRAAVGFRSGDSFLPLAVAAEVRRTGEGAELVWAPRPRADRASWLDLARELG